MKYFCAECQEKHDVGDIAANIYDISQNEVKDNLSWIFGSSKDELNDLYVFLMRFINNDAEKYLTVKGSEAQKYIKNPQTFDNAVKGRLTLTVEWLLERFVDCGAYKSYVLDNGYSCANPENVPAEVKSEIVFEKEMYFYFLDSFDGEKVLEHIADGDNNPFPSSYTTIDNKTRTIMRGYIRTCPHCGKRLPRAVGRAPEIIVWLAGSGRPGITTSLAATAAGLYSGKYSQHGLSMKTLLYDSRWDDLLRDIKQYVNGYIVCKTLRCFNEVPTQSMLIQIGDESNKPVSRVVTFVDTPIEFLDNEGQGLSAEFFEMYSRMLKNIDYVWWHVSKLLPYEIDIGNDCDRSELQCKIIRSSGECYYTNHGNNSAHISEILWEIRNLLKAEGHEMPPTAVVLTKTDIDLNDIDNSKKYSLFPVEDGKKSTDVNSANIEELKAVLKKDENGSYYFDEGEFRKRAEKTRAFFNDINPGMKMAFESNCPQRCYIATSAYGHPPAYYHEEGTATTPYREMYPLLWTLADSGAITKR